MNNSSSSGRGGHSGVRRIMRELQELIADDSDMYTVQPLENNIFEIHFTLRGGAGTDFQGGLYHGRILLPSTYPHKPPDIIFLTPSGRFETNKKICLSISSYHPEHWVPSWGLSTILTATATFMTTAGGGAVGAIDATPALRQQLANESLTWSCPVCKLSNEEMFPRAHDLFEKEKAEKMEKDKAKATANDKPITETASGLKQSEPSAKIELQKEEMSIDVINVTTLTPEIMPEIDLHFHAETMSFDQIVPSKSEEPEQSKHTGYSSQIDSQKHDQIENNAIETNRVTERTPSNEPPVVRETVSISSVLDPETSLFSSPKEEHVVEHSLETATPFGLSEKIPEHEKIPKEESNPHTIEVRADTLRLAPSLAEQEPTLISPSVATSIVSDLGVSQTGLRQRLNNSTLSLAQPTSVSPSQDVLRSQPIPARQTTSTALTTPVVTESDAKASLQASLVATTTVPPVQPQELGGENNRVASPASSLTRLFRSLRQQETQLVIVDTSLCMLLAIVFFIFIHSRYFHGTLLNFLNDFS